jgi:hypothetical protein
VRTPPPPPLLPPSSCPQIMPESAWNCLFLLSRIAVADAVSCPIFTICVQQLSSVCVMQPRYNMLHEHRLRQLKEHGIMLQVQQGWGLFPALSVEWKSFCFLFSFCRRGSG